MVILVKQIEDMIKREMTFTEARLNMAGKYYLVPLQIFGTENFSFLRLLYRILNNSVNTQKYSIDDVSWSKNLRVLSFVFNTKGIDDRYSAEKIRNPIVLDVGFCDATIPSLLPGSNPSHLVDAGNALLGGKGKKAVSSLSSIIIILSLIMRSRRLSVITVVRIG